MIRTFKYKLYSNKKNDYLLQQINIAGCIYNHCIALHKRYYRLYKKHLKVNRLQLHITKLKRKPRFQYWNNLNSQAIQDITERIDKGYSMFYKFYKTRKISTPSFKKVRRYKSITLKQCGYKILENNKIKIGKNKYSFWKSRELGGKVKTLTIKRDNLGDIYLYFVIEVENPKEIKSKTGKIAGFDYGCKTFLTLDNGEKIESPYYLKKVENKVKKEQRILAKKVKGSNNRRKSIMNLNRLSRKVVNQRKDFQFKLANNLLDKYDILCFENLNMKWMQRGHGRKTMEHSFSNFLNILRYLAEINKKKVVEISRVFPSSQLCNNCGWRYRDLGLEERSWECDNCHAVHDRDINAAKNIREEGRALSSELRLSQSLLGSARNHNKALVVGSQESH